MIAPLKLTDDTLSYSPPTITTTITPTPTSTTEHNYNIVYNDYNNIVYNTKHQNSDPFTRLGQVIPLLDLRSSGDPVYHYTARIKSLQLNGYNITNFPILYAIFDTGTVIQHIRRIILYINM